MPTIYVDLDNSDPKHRIFDLRLAGDQADAVAAKFVALTTRLIDKESDFTTTKPKGDAAQKDVKGYILRLSLTKVEADKRNAKCSLRIDVMQYPREENSKGVLGEVSTGISASGAASSTSSATAIADCVAAVAEDRVPVLIQAMRKHFATRR